MIPTESPGESSNIGRPSRLLVVTSLYPTPDRPEVGPFVRRRVEALRARGVEVQVLAAPDYRSSALLRHLIMLVRGLTLRWRPDGIEAHVLFPSGLIALTVARLRRRPLVVYAHGSDVSVSANRSPFHRFLSQLVARKADAVVANSQTTAVLVARLGAAARIVPPGVDFERFRPGDRVRIREHLGLPVDTRIALYVGTLSRMKGADTFAEAVDRAGGWLGVMVGGGDLLSSLRERHPGVRLVGVVEPDDVPAWMAAGDAVVVTSRREALGLAAVEALACGVPVVASATGGLAEVVRHEVNGLLVPAGDAAAVAAALVRLEDDAFVARLARTARESVAGHDMRRTSEAMAAVWRPLGVRV